MPDQEYLLAGLLPQVRLLAEAHRLEMARLSVVIKFTQTLRTDAEQDALYEKGRTTQGVICRHAHDPRPRPLGACPVHPLGLTVTKAKAGQSWHNSMPSDLPLVGSRAYDVAIVTYQGDKTPQDLYDGPWDLVGQTGEALGLEWGGRWKSGADLPHFQLLEGLTLYRAKIPTAFPSASS